MKLMVILFITFMSINAYSQDCCVLELSAQFHAMRLEIEEAAEAYTILADQCPTEKYLEESIDYLESHIKIGSLEKETYSDKLYNYKKQLIQLYRQDIARYEPIKDKPEWLVLKLQKTNEKLEKLEGSLGNN